MLEFALLVTAGVLDAATPGGIDGNSPVAVLVGMRMFGGLLLDMLGIGLGIAGLCQSHRSKLFAVLGLTIGVVVL